MDLGPVGPKLLFLFNLLARENIKWLTLGVPPSPRFLSIMTTSPESLKVPLHPPSNSQLNFLYTMFQPQFTTK